MSTILLPIFFCSLRCWHCFVASLSLLVWSLNQSFHMGTNFSNSNKTTIIDSCLQTTQSWKSIAFMSKIESLCSTVVGNSCNLHIVTSNYIYLEWGFIFVFGTKDGLRSGCFPWKNKCRACNASIHHSFHYFII
jgi:hypothetical protein